jgi:hypothetical protein
MNATFEQTGCINAIAENWLLNLRLAKDCAGEIHQYIST